MPTIVGLVVVAAAILGTLAHQSASSSAPSFNTVLRGDHDTTTTEADGPVTESDGVLPDGVTVFDDQHSGVANLDPDLLQALREAATDAADDGIEFHVNSGWRSATYQNQLLREAVSQYGSAEEAGRWVATADTSAHVSGNAVDIGPFDATEWLSQHGVDYGLCQTYNNEPWHYELRPTDRDCPPAYPDPTHDPRMQQRPAPADSAQISVPTSPPPLDGLDGLDESTHIDARLTRHDGRGGREPVPTQVSA